MAQILKNSVKDQIIDSATTELLEYGYKDSSMRRIAKNAQMTVGNLYRYFNSKDEMINFIIDPTFERINLILKDLTGNGVVIGKDEIDVSILENGKIYQILDSLAEELVNIYSENPNVMKIIMMHSNVNQYVNDWFAKLILKLFEKQNIIINQAEQRKCETLSKAYASSIIEGVRECFKDDRLTTAVIKAYFRSFIEFLNIHKK